MLCCLLVNLYLIHFFFGSQPRSKKSLQLKYKNLKKFVKDKVSAHKRGVMGTGGGSGPGELTFKHPIFMELYEAIRLAVDGHPPRYDNDDNDDADVASVVVPDADASVLVADADADTYELEEINNEYLDKYNMQFVFEGESYFNC